MSSQSINSVYIPVHRRSPSAGSSSSGSWRSGAVHENSLAARRIYSISELLQLSASPLARLSHSQEEMVHDHLYLASSRKHSKPTVIAPTVPTTPIRVAVKDNAAALQSRQQQTRRRSGSVRRNGVSELSRGRRNGWGYAVHPMALQNGWRDERHSPVVVLGA